jgi:anti-sigma regulatory factor (Ser/Thr protein kinase)
VTKRSSADMDGPTPLLLRLPANAASLAIIRARLRRWMPTAAVDAAAAADILLAVGEAASNAIEHATRGSSHEVELEVSARTTRTGLVLTVRDTGRWHPPHEPPGLRGHGSRLMNALVDAVTITPTPQGTTVEMRKELHP